MAAKLFNAVICAPIIVISMIIGQIYFEDYWWTMARRRLSKIVLTMIIVISYFVQEYWLLRITLLSIGEVAFMMVVPLTLLFRNKQNKIWWGLLILTPLFTNSIQVLASIESTNAWWFWLLESGASLMICGTLTNWQRFSLRTRYTVAIIGLGLLEALALTITREATAANITAATLGLLIILVFEGQRYTSEVKNKERIKLLQRESERDDLTGLLNYRALSQEIKMLTKNNQIHSIVIGGLDIDHFKRINDSHGHFVGNEVLNFFSTVLRKRIHAAFPNHGYVYRFGGEEFSIVVSNHPIREVYDVLQSIEEDMAKQSITTKEGVTVSISFSAGLTNHLSGEPLDVTLKRADKMLYSVKNNGRGWIVTDHHKAMVNKSPS